MRPFFYISAILFCLYSSTVYCQNSIDDILVRLESSKDDTVRANLYLSAAIALTNSDNNEAMLYADSSFQLSSDLKYTTGIGNSLLVKSELLLLQNRIPESKTILKHFNQLFKSSINNVIWGKYYTIKGDIYKSEFAYDSAQYFYERSLAIFKNNNKAEEYIGSLNKCGHLFYQSENYKKALDYYLKALSFSENNNFKRETAKAKINVANVLNIQTEYTRAIRYLNESLVFYKETNDLYNQGVCYNNIAANYINQDSLPQALYYLDNALKIYSQLKNMRGQSACYTNKGIVLSKLDNHEEALKSFKSALKINEELNDKNRIVLTLSNLSISYLNLKDYDKVIDISERGLLLADELNVLDAKKTFYGNLSAVYDSLLEYRLALKFQKLFKATSDSLNSSNQRAEILELEKTHNTEKIEIEISNLTTANKLKSALLEKNRNVQWFLIVISILAIILLIVFYRLYKLRVYSFKLLAKKNTELLTFNTALKASETKLQELNATKDKFFTIIAHDIKNPLSSYRSITKMLTNSFYELSEEEKLEQLKRINKSSDSLFGLFQNLLLWSTSQADTIKFNPVEVDLGVLVFKAVTILEESAQRKKIYVNSMVNTGIYAYCDANMISVVILNLISNAINYSHHNGEITIKANSTSTHVSISVTDNGIGMEEQDLNNLFKVEFDHKTIGNSTEKGTGIGLILCKEFIQKNGGEIYAISKIGAGSTFTFTLIKS